MVAWAVLEANAVILRRTHDEEALRVEIRPQESDSWRVEESLKSGRWKRGGPLSASQEYVLGTHDEEAQRLGLQHQAWREDALRGWRTAGFGPGATVLDVGCGPGYAAMDLAELVGPSGRVIAVDKSDRFLGLLKERARERHLNNVMVHRADLEAGEFPENVMADGAWLRWVLAFVKNPKAVLAEVTRALGRRGAIVIHEYFDYGTWRGLPRFPELEEFVTTVKKSWRENGGEPDIALSLPQWLEELGFEVQLRPIIGVAQQGSLKWEWMSTFLRIGRDRLVELGFLTKAQAEELQRAFSSFQQEPGARLITPGVLEVVARRR